jgi:O-antigen ligase
VRLPGIPSGSMTRALGIQVTRLELVAAAGGVVLAAAAGMAIAVPGGPLGAGRALAALVALGAAVLTLVDLRAGLVLVVLSLAVPVPVIVYGFDLHPAHLIVGLFAVRAGAEAWVGRARVPATILIPTLVILFSVLVASAAGPRFGGSLFRLIDVFALPLAGALAIAAVFDPERDLRALVLACAGALAVVGLTAAAQSAGYSGGPLEQFEEGRANALFEHPNVLGGFVAPLVALMAGVAACAWRRMLLMPLTLGIPLLLGAAALIFSLSRGALAGVAAALAVMFVLLIARRQTAAVLGMLALLTVALLVALPQVPMSQRAEFAERLQQLTQPGAETGRELIYRQGMRMLGEYPLTGVGPLTFGQLTRESTPIPDIEPGREHAHNLFLEGALSLGPLGLLALLWLVVGAARRYLRRARPTSDPLVLGWSVGAVGALVAMLVQGMGDFIFSNLEPLGLLAVLIGVGYGLGRAERPAAA